MQNTYNGVLNRPSDTNNPIDQMAGNLPAARHTFPGQSAVSDPDSVSQSTSQATDVQGATAITSEWVVLMDINLSGSGTSELLLLNTTGFNQSVTSHSNMLRAPKFHAHQYVVIVVLMLHKMILTPQITM